MFRYEEQTRSQQSSSVESWMKFSLYTAPLDCYIQYWSSHPLAPSVNDKEYMLNSVLWNVTLHRSPSQECAQRLTLSFDQNLALTCNQSDDVVGGTLSATTEWWLHDDRKKCSDLIIIHTDNHSFPTDECLSFHACSLNFHHLAKSSTRAFSNRPEQIQSQLTGMSRPVGFFYCTEVHLCKSITALRVMYHCDLMTKNYT